MWAVDQSHQDEVQCIPRPREGKSSLEWRCLRMASGKKSIRVDQILRKQPDVQSRAFSEFMRDAVGPFASGVHW